MRRVKYVVFLLVLGILSGCKTTWLQLNSEDQVFFYDIKETDFQKKIDERTRQLACRNWKNYTYNSSMLERTPMKKIRVNVHFINNKDGTANFDGKEAVEYAKGVIHHANKKLENNQKMALPENNETPAMPIPFRYILTSYEEGDEGVYVHYDENPWFINYGKNTNNYDQKILRKYEVRSDSILNIFFMVHHPDSIASSTYKAGHGGIALGNCVKVGIEYKKGIKPWSFVGLLNHEIGHVLSLRHAWGKYDGCDDTPVHPNCWNRGAAPCNGAVSNNVMDYNSVQDSYSPCQIGRAYATLSKSIGSKRPLVVHDWCDYDITKSIFIRDSTVWGGSIDLYGDVYIESGGFLQINCQVHFPKYATLYVHSGGTLLLNRATLYNDCGEAWNGIQIEKIGNKKGKVLYYGKNTLKNLKNNQKLTIEN